MKTEKMKTVSDYTKAGYVDGDIVWYRGYISRKNFNPDSAPVFKSAKGKPFYLAPSWKSTTYCLKIYLVKRGGHE